ncbi:MAG TPA: hypothetical protein VN728_05480 [Stellaceae bacterium]|jgi:hypothetical protein|nr:hypothetical protein [Stellaceae bacterium]
MRAAQVAPKFAIIAEHDRFMSRVILLALLAATLAACSEAGPYGYGYAVNGRPSLTQLSVTPPDSANPFHSRAAVAVVTPEAK